MRYGKIIINIKVDESKLLPEHKEQIEISKEDYSQNHPLEKGYKALVHSLGCKEHGALECFSYLGKAVKAVEIDVIE